MNAKLLTENERINKRDSNFELLRIILILMIIVLHYFNGKMGGLFNNVEKNTFIYYLSHFIEALCIVAVNVFIIITGYFSCKKTSIKISKPINLFILSVFYGITISIGVIFTTNIDINNSAINRIFTTSFSRWFVLIYCILYLLIPYINKFIKSLTQKQYEILLIINTIFFYIWPTIFTTTTIADNGYGIVNFINLYMIGAYIKIYKDKYIPKKISLIVYFICTIITTGYSFFTGRAWNYTTIMNLVGSIAIFQLFKSIKIKNNKVINKLSTYTFSTYIIHENTFLVTILYRNLFQSNNYWNNNWMIINLLITVIGIYIICVVIEFIRRLLLKRIIDDVVEEKIKNEICCL